MTRKLIPIAAFAFCFSLYGAQAVEAPLEGPKGAVDFSNIPKESLEGAAKASDISSDALKCKLESDSRQVACMNKDMCDNETGYVKNAALKPLSEKKYASRSTT